MNSEQAIRLDPTGCMDLRQKLLTLYRRAAARWRSDLYRIIVGEDTLGLGPNALVRMDPVDRTERFMSYARWSAVRSFDLRGDASMLMHKVYSRGVLAAYREEREASQPSQLRASSLYVTQLLNDVTATTEAALAQMVHAVAIAFRGPRIVYRKNIAILRKIVVPRLSISGQTLITQAYNHGRLDAYAQIGIGKVRIKAESMPAKPIMDARSVTVGRRVALKTAGDDHVCSICEDLEDNEYTIEEARGVIPVHPNCRCVFVRAEE